MILETKEIIPGYMNYKRIDKTNVEVAKALCARDSKGFNTGFDTQNGVIEKEICRMTGRNPEHPTSRQAGLPTEQRLEKYEGENLCGALTTVQKDNMVLETIRIKQATKDGYIEMEPGGVADLSYPNSKTRRGRVQEKGTVCPTLTAGDAEIYRIEKQAYETLEQNDCEPGDTINPFNQTVDKSGVCPTITTRPEGMKTAILPVTVKYRIRKLTPLECFRLMGVTDADAKKMLAVNSNSQCYKQAGNSIVVDVMAAMFRRLV